MHRRRHSSSRERVVTTTRPCQRTRAVTIIIRWNSRRLPVRRCWSPRTGSYDLEASEARTRTSRTRRASLAPTGAAARSLAACATTHDSSPSSCPISIIIHCNTRIPVSYTTNLRTIRFIIRFTTTRSYHKASVMQANGKASFSHDINQG